MCEFIDFTKLKIFSKKEEAKKAKGNCQTIPIALYYVNKYLKDASVKVNNKDDFGAIVSMNKAVDLLLKNNETDINVDILGIVNLNAKNYELANMYFYRVVADPKKRDKVPLMLFLACILDLQKSQLASNQIKNMLFEYATCPVAQVADILNGLKNELTSAIKCKYNFEALKLAFIKLAKGGKVTEARQILNMLWELDKTEPYTNFWYFNLENCLSFYDVGQVPFIEIAKKCDEVLEALNDDKVLYELCTRRDCDCLVRFVMQFSGKEVARLFFSYALRLKDSRLTYNLFNYLFMSGNEEKKMILFLLCIKESLMVVDGFFVMRYKDFVVNVKFFSYSELMKLNKVIAEDLLSAIKQLIKAGFTNIDISDTLIDFVNNYYCKMIDDELQKTNMVECLIKIYCEKVGVVFENLKFD